jgi:twitching motility protein PilT
MELALEAAETGHLVLSTLTTMTPEKAVERIVSAFSVAEQQTVRDRLARMLRCIACQRLIPRQDGERVAVFEVVDGNASSLGLQPEDESTRATHNKGSRRIDAELDRLIRAGVITPDVALIHAIDPGSLSARFSKPAKPRLR